MVSHPVMKNTTKAARKSVRLALQAQGLPLSNYTLIRPFFQSEHTTACWRTRTCSLLMRTQVVKLFFYSKEAFFTPKFPTCWIRFCLCGSGCGSNEKTAAKLTCRRTAIFALWPTFLINLWGQRKCEIWTSNTEKPPKTAVFLRNLVRVTGFEPAASCSQSRRATNCATPGYLVFSESPRVFPKLARCQLRYTRL